MDITGFVDHLKRRKGDYFKTNRDVANYLNTKPAQLYRWLNVSKKLTNLELERLFERTRKAAADEALHVAIVPIVEYFPIDRVESKQGMKWGRVGGVVTEPRPSQTRACAFTHSVLRMSVSLTARRLIA